MCCRPTYEGSTFDYQHYDPPRDLSPLLPQRAVSCLPQEGFNVPGGSADLKKQGFDIYVNLCEGYLDSDTPSIDVIMALEQLHVPYTGPTLTLYDPPKDLMKLVAQTQGVAVPAFIVAETIDEVSKAVPRLQFPLFVKPNTAGDSLGIDHDSLVYDTAALLRKARVLLEAYGAVLIEAYIAGREFTVLVCADPDPTRRPACAPAAGISLSRQRAF